MDTNAQYKLVATKLLEMCLEAALSPVLIIARQAGDKLKDSEPLRQHPDFNHGLEDWISRCAPARPTAPRASVALRGGVTSTWLIRVGLRGQANPPSLSEAPRLARTVEVTAAPCHVWLGLRRWA